MRYERNAHGGRARSVPIREPVAPLAPRRVAASRADGERGALMRIAAAAAGACDLDEVIELTAEAALEAIGACSLSISHWERERERMRVLINVGQLGPGEERFPAEETYPLATYPIVAALLREGVPYFNAVDDPDADPRAIELLRSLDKESDIGVPILVDGGVWGEVWASTASGEPRFRARDVRFLEAIAGQLADVIARAELFSNVSRMAYEDPLTGLANRRAFEERLERAVPRARADGAPLTLMLCDVDDLKAINDGRGHQAGDRALRRVGEALVVAAATFPGSTIGRLSGDEFAVLLDGRPAESAREVAATALHVLREDRDLPVSLSCGAASVSTGVDTGESLMRAADTAQYAAKRRGGGQFCTAEASAVHESLSPRLRSRRRGAPDALDEATEQLVSILDNGFGDRSTLDRLETVVAGVAETLNAAAWTISFSEHGCETIQSICTADDRDSRLRGLRVGLDDEVYVLADYPLTADLVAAGHGAFLVDRQDRRGDPAERELLGELGFSAVLGAAVSDLDGVYLLEIYADADTVPLEGTVLRVSLLARAAAGRSSGATERMRQLQKRTHQLTANAALGARLAGMLDEGAIVEAAVDELYRQFGFPVCAIDRLTEDGHLEIAAGRGGAVDRLREAGWTQPAGLGLVGRAMRERDVVVVGDVLAEPDYRSTSETPDTRSELCAPLWAGDRQWGAIDLQDPRVDAFDEDDVRLVRTVADQVSAALRSAALYSQLEGAYLGTAEALVAALEAKDAYTASHSRSIAENSEAVGRKLGMDEEEVRTLRFAAAFHDIGKLAIPESILGKRGPLTASERVHVQQHTVIGEQILSPIEFLADVRPLVRHGHERFDGGGYPDGLAADDIPLGSRIIFACDAYDAMTTDRPYRAGMSDEDAAAELRRCAGTQFDPRVVEALLSVLDEAEPLQHAAAAS